MSQLYESLDIVNSWHAIDAETGAEIPCMNTKGFIKPNGGTTILFENPRDNSDRKYVSVSTLVFTNGETPTTIIINDNEKYPFYLDAREVRGIDYMRVHKMKVIRTGGFYYEGMTSDH